MTNIVNVTFSGKTRTVTDGLFQYDYGQILNFTDLELPKEFEIDFTMADADSAETYLGENNQVQIPNKYLQKSGNLKAYIFLHAGDTDGETVYTIVTPVRARPERTDPVPSSEQKSRIDTLIEQMDEAVQTAEASAESAQQSAEEAHAVIADIGDTVEQAVEDYMDTHPVDVPVDSVNGKTGAVVLNASDVGALPDSTVIPSKTSQLQNDSGYLTAIPSEYVTEQELNAETDRATAAESALSTRITTNASAIGSLQRDMQTAQSDITDEVTRATQAEASIRSDIPTSAQISALAPVQSVNGQTGAVTIPAEGLSEDAKNALIDCFRHVAWIDSDGTQYVNALISALYELQSITAVYTQSGTAYDTDSLDDLKTDLVVTAHYKDGTTETVTAYTLSGTLTEGTSTITVSYEGLTDTFNVTVSHLTILYPLENGTHVFTDKNNRTVSVSNQNHIEFTDPSPTTNASDKGSYIDLRNVSRNNTTGTDLNNINRSDVWFTIPAGASYRLEVKNISSNHLVSTRSFAVTLKNGKTTKIHSGDFHDNTGTSVTGTASSDIAITALTTYISYDYEYANFDVEFYVNDVRWI